MGSQRFCLKWNNHQSNMAAEFENLYESESFVDVTLACDGSTLKAHKIVLSACSPFFRSLLMDNPCDHPIIIMKDMKYSHLKSILQFMYKGEVSIPQDQLPSLVNAAETLKVKGLAEVPQHQPEQPSNQQYFGEAFENNNQPLSSSINFNHRKKRKRLRDGTLHRNHESYPPVKSKLESTLLGELDAKSASQLPLNESHAVKTDLKSISTVSTISDGSTLEISNDPVIDNSNASSEFSSSPNGKNASDQSLHHASPNVDPPTSHDTLSLLPHSSFSSASHLEQRKDSISEDMEDIDQKPKLTPFMTLPNEDFTPRSADDENDTVYDDSANSTLNNINSSDLSCTPPMSIHDGSVNIRRNGLKSEVKRQCPICKKVLKSAQINRHINAVHLKKQFTCEFCTQKYNDKSNLKRHMKTGHSSDYQPSTSANIDIIHDNNNSDFISQNIEDLDIVPHIQISAIKSDD